MMTALITGANKGVGFATARALGRQGIKVLLGARSEELGRKAEAILRGEGIDAIFVQLDVTDSKSIAAARDWIAANVPVLDILVNNAGVQSEMKADFSTIQPSQLSLETLRRTYEVNLFGLVAVTQAMLPLLRKSPSARIVNLASRLGSFSLMTDPNWEAASVNMLAYNSSKAAMHFATICFATELRDSGIKVNAVSPGTIASDLSGIPAEDLKNKPGFGKAEDGAAIIAQYATLPDDGPTGGFYGPGGLIPW